MINISMIESTHDTGRERPVILLILFVKTGISPIIAEQEISPLNILRYVPTSHTMVNISKV